MCDMCGLDNNQSQGEVCVRAAAGANAWSQVSDAPVTPVDVHCS